MLYLDIEADNLLRDATTIWCVVVYDDETNNLHIYHKPLDNGKEVEYPKTYLVYKGIQCNHVSTISTLYTYTDIHSLLMYIQDKPVCTFNGIMFDMPLLNKLYHFNYTLDKQVDLHLLSRLYYPDRAGHSLAWFGQLLGFPKGDHSDWSCFSQEMLDYCIRDVEVTVKVHKYLENEAKDWDWSEAIKLEYKIADIQMRQEMKGVLFDVGAAKTLSSVIEAELETLEEKIMIGLPKIIKQVGATVDKPFKKNGELSKQCEEWLCVS